MTQEVFIETTQQLLPNCVANSIPIWIEFATECVDSNQFVDFVPQPNKTAAIEKWLDVIHAGLQSVKSEYGEDIANQVCNLSLLRLCLYPGEMAAAAEHLKNGGNQEAIEELIENGTLEGDSLFYSGKSVTQSAEKGYVLAVCTDSDFYIPNAEHIERNDSLIPWEIPDDDAAAKVAESDGVRLIYGMDNVPDGVYIDTPENREIIIKSLNEQEYHKEVQQNNDKMFSDLPGCTLLFHRLETDLGGKSDGFAEWLRTSYELNSDFDIRPLEMATLICDALMESKHLYGVKIARDLYDARTIVLPNEIRSASRFLSLGGQMESLEGLAQAGFLMEDLHDYGHEDVVRVAKFMNGGGAAEDAFAVLLSSESEQQCDMAQQMG